MSTTMASRDVQEPAEGGASASPRIVAALILVAVLAAACALQVFTAPSLNSTTTSYTACLGADGSLYGLGEGPFAASHCNPGDDTIQATMIRDGGRWLP